MKKLMIAIQFLTIVPLAPRMQVTAAEVGASAGIFPLVGLGQGALLAALAYASQPLLPPELSAYLVVAALSLITGGFHLDGLADTFDALAKRGDRAAKLKVMKGSTIGSIGMLAIALAVLGKYLLLKELLLASPRNFWFGVLFMPVASKWAMLVAMYHGRPARPEGLGKIFIDHARLTTFIMGTAITFTLLLTGLFTINAPVLGNPLWWTLFRLLLVLATIYFLAILATAVAEQQLGGHTGDTFGAVAELSDLGFLAVVLVWSRHSIL